MAGTFWTGLPGLDDFILPGSIPPRSLNVIGGALGTGKTVLALQKLFANATPENRALYFIVWIPQTTMDAKHLKDILCAPLARRSTRLGRLGKKDY
jgi:type II secretory pathway predicted ATPase ExeA